MVSATIPHDAPSAASQPGLLDPHRRKLLLSLLTQGLSRRKAARLVGCHPATIGRTAQREPEFRCQLIEAEECLTLMALDRVQTAARDLHNWRAAAWILERRDPEVWGRKSKAKPAAAELPAMVQALLDVVAAAGVSAEQLANIQAGARQVLDDFLPADDDDEWPCDEPETPPPTAQPASPPPARNAPTESNANSSSTQPVAAQQVTSSNPAVAGATSTAGVAQQRSKKRKDQRKNYGLPFGRLPQPPRPAPAGLVAQR